MPARVADVQQRRPAALAVDRARRRPVGRDQLPDQAHVADHSRGTNVRPCQTRIILQQDPRPALPILDRRRHERRSPLHDPGSRFDRRLELRPAREPELAGDHKLSDRERDRPRSTRSNLPDDPLQRHRLASTRRIPQLLRLPAQLLEIQTITARVRHGISLHRLRPAAQAKEEARNMINFPEVDTVLPADPEAPSSAHANRSRGLPGYDTRRRTRAQANASGSYAVEEPRSRSLGSSRMSSNTIVFGPSRSSAGESPPAKARARMPAARAASTPERLSSTTTQPGRRGRHLLGSVQEEVRGGLASGDVLRTEDPPLEPLVQACQPERVAQVLVSAARRDAARQGDRVECLQHAFDGSELGLERLSVERLYLLFPVDRQLASEVRLDCGLGVAVGAPDEPLDHLRLAERPSQLAQHQHVHLDRQALAVDEHAIAIEDHESDGPGGEVGQLSFGYE